MVPRVQNVNMLSQMVYLQVFHQFLFNIKVVKHYAMTTVTYKKTSLAVIVEVNCLIYNGNQLSVL